VRLFTELQASNRDLSESLQQQTATADVLKVISRSPGELQPVFQAILENAVRICNARFGNLSLYDGRELRMAAMHNAPPAFDELRRREPVIPAESVVGRIVNTRKAAHFADLSAEEPHASSALVRVAGARTAVGVPMPPSTRRRTSCPAGDPGLPAGQYAAAVSGSGGAVSAAILALRADTSWTSAGVLRKAST
jgi:hypothetical protein